METINIRYLDYNHNAICSSEAMLYNSSLGLFKRFNINTPMHIKENKKRKLLELEKITILKQYYNEIICLVNNYTDEYLAGYIIKPSNGYPLDETFLLPEEKIKILKKLKEIISLFEKNGVIYEDIHFDNIYYDKKSDKLELIDIDNIEINGYKKDLESFLTRKYYMYGGKNAKNARIFNFNLITYMYLTNNFSSYNIRDLIKSFNKDVSKLKSKKICKIFNKLLTAEINSECDNIYLIDMIDEKILRK